MLTHIQETSIFNLDTVFQKYAKSRIDRIHDEGPGTHPRLINTVFSPRYTIPVPKRSKLQGALHSSYPTFSSRLPYHINPAPSV